MTSEATADPGARRMVRQSGLTSVAAAAAIASGLVLDVVIAARFGAGRATDAFFVATRLPLGLVQMVLVGANQTLVPATSGWLVQHGLARATRLISDVLALALVAGLVVAGVGAVVAGPLVDLTAPGFDPGEARLATSLLRAMFLVVPLVAGAEVLRAFLNARYAFVAPAAMNVVMNGAAAAIIWFASRSVHVLPWAYVAGAAAQLVFMLAVAWARGFRYRPALRPSPEAAAAVRLCARPLVGAGLNPVARVGEQMIVSFLPRGSVTVLNYATRLVSAVGGSVFFRSVIVAIVPRLSEAHARGDAARVGELTRFGVRTMLVISAPLTAFMAVLAEPASLVVFRRGDFSRADAELLGLVLAVLAASLVGMGVQRALLAPFFARLDTRTPLRNTVYGVVANLALLPVLVVPFRDSERAALVMVAVVFSISQYVNVAHAWFHLRRDASFGLAGVARLAVLLGAASLVAALVMVAVGGAVDLYELGDRVDTALRTAVTAAAGLAVIGASVLAGRRLRV